MNREYDILIMGGGPAGSTCATMMAREGLSVLVLERHKFPRFHIGESITAFGFRAFRELGVYEELKAQNYVKKKGLEFVMREKKRKIYFPPTERNEPDELPWAFQMERSKIDHTLLKNARRNGAEVREECLIKKVLFEGDRAVGVQYRDLSEGGPEELQEVRAKWIIDASGQAALINRQLDDNLHDDPLLEKKFAVFSHWEGGIEIPNDDEELNFKLCVHDNRRDWAWYLPIGKNKVSLGVVLSQKTVQEATRNSQDLEEIFYHYAKDIPYVDKLLANPELQRVEKFRCVKDYSYRSTRFWGKGWALVGDSGGFIDPVFSTGMQIAFNSAFALIDELKTAFQRPDPENADLSRYQKKFDDYYRFNSMFVYLFYLSRLDYSLLSNGRYLWRNIEWASLKYRMLFLWYGQRILWSSQKKVQLWGEQVLFGNPSPDNLIARFLLVLSRNYDEVHANKARPRAMSVERSEAVAA